MSCDSSTPEFYYTQGGLKYKYHDIVEDGKTPAVGDYLTVYIEYRSSEGELIYSSVGTTYDDKQVIHLGYPDVEGGIEEGFAQLMEGDSVTFYIEAQKFYEHYLFKEIPSSLSPESEVTITLRLLQIETAQEYNKRQEEEEVLCELEEFTVIDSIVNSWKEQGDLVEEVNGIYMVKGMPETKDTIKYGTGVKVYYEGYYPNKKVFYSNLNAELPDEFKAGVEGQTIVGMKIALLSLYKGQSAKIVVPSYLGFNDQMIKSGTVPSCTPLIFNLEVVKE